MTKEEFQQLYKEVILAESKSPLQFYEMENATLQLQAYNPICGDKYTLYLLEDAGKITDASFTGFGCAVSKASTSFLLQKIVGKSTETAVSMIATFLDHIDRQNVENETDEQLKLMIELLKFDGRKDCVELSWHAVKKGI